MRSLRKLGYNEEIFKGLPRLKIQLESRESKSLKIIVLLCIGSGFWVTSSLREATLSPPFFIISVLMGFVIMGIVLFLLTLSEIFLPPKKGDGGGTKRCCEK